MGRHALLVATGSYTEPLLRRLRSPAQDVLGLAEILRDRELGGFDEVRVCVDRPEHELRMAVADVLSDRLREDLVLIYLSGHGVQDRRGRLYFAANDTRLDRISATALAASFVDDQLSQTAAGGRVLILDCCFSGAFAHGLAVKASAGSPLAGKLGRGYVVLTATDAFEYALEGQSPPDAAPRPSVCTNAIITGLRTGQADGDGDGWVSTDDLYHYVYQAISGTAAQTPTYFASDVQGKLLLTRVPGVTPPAPQTSAPSVRPHRRARLLLACVLAAVAAVFTLLPPAAPPDSFANITGGAPLLADGLHDNSAGNHWREGSTGYGECRFTQGVYHAVAGSGNHSCCMSDVNLDNLAAQVDVTINSGDEGGIAFRWHNSAGYFFQVTREGNYRLFTYDPGSHTTVDLSRSPGAGPNRSTRLGMLARGRSIELYVNGHQVGATQDTSYTAGQIGLCARDFSNGTDVTFTNLQVWRA